MRYRAGFHKTVAMNKDEVYEIRVGPLSTANVFATKTRR